MRTNPFVKNKISGSLKNYFTTVCSIPPEISPNTSVLPPPSVAQADRANRAVNRAIVRINIIFPY